jgi:hypothetical protein
MRVKHDYVHQERHCSKDRKRGEELATPTTDFHGDGALAIDHLAAG